MNRWLEIGRIEDIPPLGARVVRSSEGDIAVFRAKGDEIFALEDRCPHRGGPLSQGIVHNGKVTCPLHNWAINLSNGEAVAPDEGCAKKFPVRIVDGTISLQLEVKPVIQAVLA